MSYTELKKEFEDAFEEFWKQWDIRFDSEVGKHLSKIKLEVLKFDNVNFPEDVRVDVWFKDGTKFEEVEFPEPDYIDKRTGIQMYWEKE